MVNRAICSWSRAPAPSLIVTHSIMGEKRANGTKPSPPAMAAHLRKRFTVSEGMLNADLGLTRRTSVVAPLPPGQDKARSSDPDVITPGDEAALFASPIPTTGPRATTTRRELVVRLPNRS